MQIEPFRVEAWPQVCRYYNLQRWTEFPHGGHFAAFEEPQAIIEDIRTFYRGLR